MSRIKNFWQARIADGVQRAVNNLAPAKIGWGFGKVPDQVFNRRWKMKPGTVLKNPFGGTDQVQMNPGVGNPNLLEPAGPTDPELSIVSVQSADGRPLALLANYSLHYCGGVGGGHISADYYGMFADRIQQLLGADRQDPPFVAMMSNGTSGNINNVNFRGGQAKQPPYGQMRLVANEVADEALRVYQNIQHRDWAPLDAQQKEIQLGVRLPGKEEVERAKQIMAEAKNPVMQTLEQIYARETVLLKFVSSESADHPASLAHRRAAHRGDTVRSVCRNRVGTETEESTDLHHLACQRLQRLFADGGAPQIGRLRNLAGALQLS